MKSFSLLNYDSYIDYPSKESMGFYLCFLKYTIIERHNKIYGILGFTYEKGPYHKGWHFFFKERLFKLEY